MLLTRLACVDRREIVTPLVGRSASKWSSDPFYWQRVKSTSAKFDGIATFSLFISLVGGSPGTTAKVALLLWHSVPSALISESASDPRLGTDRKSRFPSRLTDLPLAVPNVPVRSACYSRLRRAPTQVASTDIRCPAVRETRAAKRPSGLMKDGLRARQPRILVVVPGKETKQPPPGRRKTLE